MDSNDDQKSGLVTLPKLLMDMLDGEAGDGPVKVSRSKMLEFILTERYARQLEEKGCRLERIPNFNLQVISQTETPAVG